jgi:hypothetical protein
MMRYCISTADGGCELITLLECSAFFVKGMHESRHAQQAGIRRGFEKVFYQIKWSVQFCSVRNAAAPRPNW